MMSRSTHRSSRRPSWDHDFDDLTSVLHDADLALAKVKSQLYPNSPKLKVSESTHGNLPFNHYSTPYHGSASAKTQYNKLQGLLTQQELDSNINSTLNINQTSSSHDLLMTMYEKLETQQKTINNLSQTIRIMEEQHKDQAIAVERLQEKIVSMQDIKRDSKEQLQWSKWKTSQEKGLRELDDRINHVEEMTIMSAPNTDIDRRFANIIDDYKNLERNVKTVKFSVSQLENSRNDIGYFKSSPQNENSHVSKEIDILRNDHISQQNTIQRINERQIDYNTQLIDLCNAMTEIKQTLDKEKSNQKKYYNAVEYSRHVKKCQPLASKKYPHKSTGKYPSLDKTRKSKSDLKIPLKYQSTRLKSNNIDDVNDDISLQFTTNYSDVVTISDIDTDELLQSSLSSDGGEDIFE